MNSLVLSRGFVMPGGGKIYPTTSDLELATKLETEFDYSGHTKKATYASIVTKLRAIGCTPFTRGSIRRYKRMMEFKETGFWHMVFSWLATVGISTVLSVFAVTHNWAGTVFAGPLLVVGIIVLAIIGVIASIGFTGYFVETSAHWEKTRISGYNGVVPDEAAKIMLKVKTAFPEVGFSIEELKVQQRVRDPFLVALIDGYLFHLAMWDEPEYIPHI